MSEKLLEQAQYWSSAGTEAADSLDTLRDLACILEPSKLSDTMIYISRHGWFSTSTLLPTLLTRYKRSFAHASFVHLRMHAFDVRYQLVISVEGFAAAAHAARTGWDVTPEVGLVGGMDRGMMSPQLGRASEGQICALLIFAHISSIAEDNANTRDSVLVLDRFDHSLGILVLLFRIDCIARRMMLQNVEVCRMGVEVERWDVLVRGCTGPDDVLEILRSQAARR